MQSLSQWASRLKSVPCRTQYVYMLHIDNPLFSSRLQWATRWVYITVLNTSFKMPHNKTDWVHYIKIEDGDYWRKNIPLFINSKMHMCCCFICGFLSVLKRNWTVSQENLLTVFIWYMPITCLFQMFNAEQQTICFFFYYFYYFEPGCLSYSNHPVPLTVLSVNSVLLHCVTFQWQCVKLILTTSTQITLDKSVNLCC